MMKKKILIIEDNELNLELLNDILDYNNYEVLSAINGEIGVEIAHRYKPDLILMDLALPGINGFEAADKIHSHEELNHIPILAVTSSVMPSDIDHIFRQGFTDLVPKPINTRSIIKKINKYL